jgi:hypothetical protein
MRSPLRITLPMFKLRDHITFKVKHDIESSVQLTTGLLLKHQVHIMAYLRLRAAQRLPLQFSVRPFSTTPLRSKLMGDNPDANLPDPSKNSSAAPNAKVRTDTQNTDQQSSASTVEHKTGDDHPAKQPDPQAEPTRSTGIGGNDKVQGGKSGLHERGDKQ